MNSRWMERASALNAAVADRLSDASQTLATHLRAANEAIGSGADQARDIGRSLTVSARRGSNSARELIAERPFESALIIGAVGVAIGWLWRRTREPRVEDAPVRNARANGARRPPPAKKAARSRAAETAE
jgi:ElaB/YqjD/DUF883 family membrane-anchored ribosome-binding protein